MRVVPHIAVFSLLVACGGSPPETASAPAKVHRPELPTSNVTLPDGSVIEAELAITPEQQGRGLMFREYLPDDKGMLFVATTSERRGFWMYQCVIPLDILWLDGSHRIVEMKTDLPPCKEADARKCPTYGGTVPSVYVLELAGGQAEAHGLKLGDQIDF